MEVNLYPPITINKYIDKTEITGYMGKNPERAMQGTASLRHDEFYLAWLKSKTTIIIHENID